MLGICRERGDVMSALRVIVVQTDCVAKVRSKRQAGMIMPTRGYSSVYVEICFLYCGAGRGNRTLTLLPELDFESSASTNSATPATRELIGVCGKVPRQSAACVAAAR
jgi:hypothetical protein